MLQLHTCSSQASSHGCFCHMDHQWGVGQLNPSEDMEMYLFQSHLQLHYNTCLTKRETQFLEGGSNLMVPGASTVSSFTRGPAWGSTIVPSGLWIPSCKKRETLMCWNCCRRSIGEEGENNLILEELGKCLSDLCKLRIADFLAEFHNLCNCSVQQLNSPCAALNWGPGSFREQKKERKEGFFSPNCFKMIQSNFNKFPRMTTSDQLVFETHRHQIIQLTSKGELFIFVKQGEKTTLSILDSLNLMIDEWARRSKISLVAEGV